MGKKRAYDVMAMFIILLFILSSVSPVISGAILRKRTINVAIIRQRWDILDTTIGDKISTPDHKRCLRDAESRYGVKFKIYEFWDDWNGGNVQDGLLEKLHIDVIIAPGGFGGLYTPKKYREEIKNFVKSGGGFYGICGDSTFGSLGLKNFPKRDDYVIDNLLGFNKFTPMLGLANVYTDASVFVDIIGRPTHFTRFDMTRALIQLAFSRAPIYLMPTDPPIQKPHFGKTVRVMLGNAPLINGNKFFMPKVIEIAILKGSDKPYDRSIEGKMAIIATTYGKGRVVLSVVHPEHTFANKNAHDIYERNVLWLARALPDV